ncbi:MAG: sigma 54-interacting transcriptional regulator, partial [Thermoanaerobaculia bacterium]
GASPVQPYSGVAALTEGLAPSPGAEAEACEEVERRLGTAGAIVVIRDPDRLDSSSLRLIRLLASSRRDLAWVWSGACAALPDCEAAQAARTFFVAARLAPLAELRRAADRLPGPDRRRWIEELIASPQFDSFLDDGIVPPIGRIELREPRRSYLGALAIAGTTVSRGTATRILRTIGWSGTLEDLADPGVVTVGDAGVAFAGESARRSVEAAVPREARSALCRVAADAVGKTDAWRSLLLRLEGGDEAAVPAITKHLPLDDHARASLLEAISRMPSDARAAPHVARLEAIALHHSGRYRVAREAAARASEPHRSILLAAIDRRLGRYSAALSRLEPLLADPSPPAEALVAAGEILRLQGDGARASSLLDRATLHAGKSPEAQQAAYERAVLAIDSGAPLSPQAMGGRGASPYLRARLATYLALRAGQHAVARTEAERALGLASDLLERIDASLDLLFSLFLAGDWTAARLRARETLALVEETEGDRAAGGVLFTLAWLCADEGEWDRAAAMLERLRAFYAHTGDARRLRETDLIAAHLAFCRGRLQEARAHVAGLDLGSASAEEREAALLLLDEADLIERDPVSLRSTGEGACVELRDRHHLLAGRIRRSAAEEIRNPFLAALSRWEAAVTAGGRPAAPEPASPGERLALVRSMQILVRRAGASDLRPRMEALAAEMGVETAAAPLPGSRDRELEILQRVASLQFPFAPGDFGEVAWRWARRNRIGDWNQVGSGEPLSAEELDGLLDDPTDGWMRCGADALLMLEGIESWSEGSRDSLGALFVMRSEHHNLKRALEQDGSSIADAPAPDEPEGILGDSPAIREVVLSIGRLAQREVPICIEGESGSGKELVARAIHRGSRRRSRPFVAVNCAALPETLFESELFGHARGAFTGADRDRAGLIETADGGTLFLDEIGEMPLAAQAKLLRFLQEGEFRRVGESAARRADVRLVTATNRRLEAEVDAGRFREDLYYRIRGIEMRVPPLRERGADILLLARRFLDVEHARHGGPSRFADDVEGALLSHEWPGNVRELEQTIKAAHAIAGEARLLSLDHLPPRLRLVRRVRRPVGNFFDEVNHFRRTLLERSLAEAGGNQSRAAKLLGISRQALAYQIRELGIAVWPRG